MELLLDPSSAESYRTFLKVKSLPTYRIQGHIAIVPDEYASLLGCDVATKTADAEYVPPSFLFDYQAAISSMAIRKRKFAIFAECGLGKSLMIFEFARHVAKVTGKLALIITPLQVVKQMSNEWRKFYGEDDLQIVSTKDLPKFVLSGSGVAVTNWEALTEKVPQGNIAGLVADESSVLKSAGGKWGQHLIRLGKGVEWKLCATGTPAPNDRIEYGNHGVFLDVYPTLNSFYAKYFINRGETQNRWEMRPHAVKPFFRSLSHWCIFLTNPATYGWKDNCENIPPIKVHIHEVDLTGQQQDILSSETGQLFATNLGGIVGRSKMSQIAKGKYKGKSFASNKPDYIKLLVDSWPDESTIIWCLFNEEQKELEKIFPDAASIHGSTKMEKREKLIEDFQAGRRKILISKAKVLGFGLNLQIATRMVFSGLDDSWEKFHQCVKRANRYGSTKPLQVHIPVTEIEQEMVSNVLRKAKRVQADTEEQEALFRQMQVV